MWWLTVSSPINQDCISGCGGKAMRLASLMEAGFPVPDGFVVRGRAVDVWKSTGYYMIILYAALQGIDPTLYEAARMDGAGRLQIATRIKIPLIAPALILILVFSLIGTLQFFNEPQILRYLAAGTIGADFTPNMYAYQQAFSLANFNYGSAISFALGGIVFICVYAFLFFTRKRRSFL